MSSPSVIEHDTEPQVARPLSLSITRPFYWSVRRELWEYRSVYVAPLAVAGLAVFGFLFRLASLPHATLAAVSVPATTLTLDRPYGYAAAAIVFCGLIVAVFYCLGALNNERRDRSILFWKSLPVSDLTAVLAKACIPLVAIPLVVFPISVATQLVMLILGSGVLLVNGLDPATIWTHWPMVQMSLALIYELAVCTLWYAPIYGWLLLVSGWARRVPILWAVLPPLGLCVVEKLGFDTSHFASFLLYRLRGFLVEGFTVQAHGHPVINPFVFLAPERFLASLSLWLGLIVAATFLAAAVWLRRYREPN